MFPQTKHRDIVYDYISKNWPSWSKGLRFYALSSISRKFSFWHHNFSNLRMMGEQAFCSKAISEIA